MSETPKFSEEFYEIEDVRRKRVHEGRTEYLIKWLGWPESSNTWESENVEEFIDDFEESLSMRKGKRKRMSTVRLTGSKRRKSGKVRRFQNATYDKSEADHGVEPDGEGPREDATYDPHKVEGFSNPCSITKIVKAIGYKVSIANDIRDVCVTFVAENSDGTEVVVNNKQLKTDNPQLLCSFYEKILYCNPHE